MKRTQKMFALLLGMIMMIGMLPSAGASMFWCPDEGLSHSWGPAEYWDGTCSWGIRYCTRCGAGEDVPPQHKWVNQTVEQPGCEEPGWKESFCSKCGDEKGDGQEIPALGHKWGSWYWVHGTPSCLEGGWQVRDCQRCGVQEDRYLEAGNHQWGEWKIEWEATCMEKGMLYSKCCVCGETKYQYYDPIDHVYGDWRVIEEPQVGIPGTERRACIYGCGTHEDREIPPLVEMEIPQMWCTIGLVEDPANGTHFVPGETAVFSIAYENPSDYDVINAIIYGAVQDTPAHNAGNTLASNRAFDGADMAAHGYGSFTLSYTVTEEDAARGAIYAEAGFWADLPSGIPAYEYITQPMLTVPCGEGELPEDDDVLMEVPGIAVIKSLHNTPANGAFYVPGEWIHFHIKVDNHSDADVTDIFVTDPLVDQTFEYALIPANDFAATVVSYQVTEQDAAIGSVENYAQVRIYTAEGYYNLTSNTVTVPCGNGDSNAVILDKVDMRSPANGEYYVPGETIQYGLTVRSTEDNPLQNIIIYDPLKGGNQVVFGPADAWVLGYAFEYTVTEADAQRGCIENIGYATFTYQNTGKEDIVYSNPLTLPCGFPEGENPFGTFDSVAVIKTEESLPLNGQFYTEGEVIHYTITYTNDGELPLTDVEIWDVMNPLTPVASAEMLNPGESRVCYYQHTVTAADVAAGSVMNVAHASYPVSNAAGFATSVSNAVISKTSAYNWVWCTPLFPDSGEDPEYDPGTGWLPGDDSVPEEYTPPFGSIDADTLHNGDSYCVRTITGRDNASVSYETAFCAAHSPIQSSVRMMSQAAATPETQLQAAAYAAALWRTEMQKLYQEIYEAADPTAKMVVMTEYVRFLTVVANYEALLNVLYPDQPALAAQKMAAMWENKCIDLCYDTHASAAERKDSLLAVTPAVGAAAGNCTCEVTFQEAGKKTEKQSYCPVHAFPFGMIDVLLQGKDTAESWTMVRQIWGVELTSAYNRLCAAMGDNKPLAMAEYNALTQWMMAREASLIALYPDNPEIAAQLMVKTIMDRVNALCQMVD